MATCETIRVAISPGELLDKITILEIKSERIDDAHKLAHVTRELAELRAARNEWVPELDALRALIAELRTLNQTLWDIEDAIRAEETAERFGPRFIALARAVYRTNDKRAEIKARINDLLGSAIAEQKSYARHPRVPRPVPAEHPKVARLAPATSSRR
jgi:hypothetical protein